MKTVCKLTILFFLISLATAMYMLPATEGESCTIKGQTFQHHAWIPGNLGLKEGECGFCFCEDTTVLCITHGCGTDGNPVAMP